VCGTFSKVNNIYAYMMKWIYENNTIFITKNIPTVKPVCGPESVDTGTIAAPRVITLDVCTNPGQVRS
jgi:hypothetical protein